MIQMLLPPQQTPPVLPLSFPVNKVKRGNKVKKISRFKENTFPRMMLPLRSLNGKSHDTFSHMTTLTNKNSKIPEILAHFSPCPAQS